MWIQQGHFLVTKMISTRNQHSGHATPEQQHQAYWEEEEELLQLPFDKEVGEVTHGVSSQRCDICEFARLFSAQCCNPFNDVVGDLQVKHQVSPSQVLCNALWICWAVLSKMLQTFS